MTFSCIVESTIFGVVEHVTLDPGDAAKALEAARDLLRSHCEALTVHVFEGAETVAVIVAADLP